jgi:hypothetical protein
MRCLQDTLQLHLRCAARRLQHPLARRGRYHTEELSGCCLYCWCRFSNLKVLPSVLHWFWADESCRMRLRQAYAAASLKESPDHNCALAAHLFHSKGLA